MEKVWRKRALQGSKPGSVLEITEAGGEREAAEPSWRSCWVMLPSPVRTLDHGLVFLFASSTWALNPHCTSPDTRWEWTLLILLLLVRALWRAKWDSKAASQCTIRGTVLPYLRLHQERSHLPFLFHSLRALSSFRAMKEALGQGKSRIPDGKAEK